MEVRNIFIIGSKGIPGKYGGYETFVDKLTEYHSQKEQLKYHVACKSDKNGEFTYNNARCFEIKVPAIGPAQAIYYDVKALKELCRYIKENGIKNPVVYILACRIGPFARRYYKKIKKLGGVLYINPDGHEWLRAKWPKPVRMYWKFSEKLMTKSCDMLICDSKNIEKYIRETYSKYSPKTCYISYGAEVSDDSIQDSEKLAEWYKEKEIKPKNYYLVVGRFVPENNYETMLREFMKSKTNKDFVLITNVEKAFLDKLKERTGFDRDKRIKFAGTVYDKQMLAQIRKNAFGYFHGHEVGGTNPSLLEALGSTDLNLLLDVGFNREVAEDSALYWTKEEGSLASLIDKADTLGEDEITALSEKAKNRIRTAYSWQFIADQYEKIFRA